MDSSPFVFVAWQANYSLKTHQKYLKKTLHDMDNMGSYQECHNCHNYMTILPQIYQNVRISTHSIKNAFLAIHDIKSIISFWDTIFRPLVLPENPSNNTSILPNSSWNQIKQKFTHRINGRTVYLSTNLPSKSTIHVSVNIPPDSSHRSGHGEKNMTIIQKKI